jgi:hypothetical protein
LKEDEQMMIEFPVRIQFQPRGVEAVSLFTTDVPSKLWPANTTEKVAEVRALVADQIRGLCRDPKPVQITVFVP